MNVVGNGPQLASQNSLELLHAATPSKKLGIIPAYADRYGDGSSVIAS